MIINKHEISIFENVYFLGAGFSKPAGFPLIYEFEEYFKKNYNFIKGKCNIQKCNEIINLLSKDDNIENLLYNSKNKEKKLIIEAIWFTINACCIAFAEGKSNFALYDKFLRRIIRENATIITLNYDTILEIVLDHYQIKDSNLNFPLVEFDYFIPDLENSRYAPLIEINNYSFLNAIKKRIVILKLHGAFNLFYCHNCGFAYIADNFAGTHPAICRKCKRSVEVAIVPPEISKKIENFRKMWDFAEKIIKNSRKLIIIGLNFNESDKDFNELIKVNIKEGNKDINLVNYSKNPNESEKEKWMKKFLSLFNIEIRKENIFLNGFENWVCKL